MINLDDDSQGTDSGKRGQKQMICSKAEEVLDEKPVNLAGQ